MEQAGFLLSITAQQHTLHLMPNLCVPISLTEEKERFYLQAFYFFQRINSATVNLHYRKW